MAGAAKKQPRKAFNNKTTDKQNAKVKKPRKKKRRQTFSRYLVKVCKIVNPDLQISSKAMPILNSFMKDMFRRLVSQASLLVIYNKRKTLTAREIETAVRLTLNGELIKHAVYEGWRAMSDYSIKKAESETF